MTPPKVLEPDDVGDAVMAGVRRADAGYGQRCRSLAAVAGIVNAAHGSLVDLTVEVLAEGDHVGPGLHSPAQFLAWRVGCSKATANQLVAVAKRVDELPCLLGALRAGEISLDQAAVVARNVPARFDASATDLARSATVEQLKAVLPAYRHDDETPEERAAREKRAAARRERSAGLFHDEDGGGRLTVHLDPAQTAAIEAAIAATRDDLFRQRQADATAAGHPDAKVEAPTLAETATALAASALAHGAAEHPGADRYLITYHLGAGPDGGPASPTSTAAWCLRPSDGACSATTGSRCCSTAPTARRSRSAAPPATSAASCAAPCSTATAAAAPCPAATPAEASRSTTSSTGRTAGRPTRPTSSRCVTVTTPPTTTGCSTSAATPGSHRERPGASPSRSAGRRSTPSASPSPSPAPCPTRCANAPGSSPVPPPTPPVSGSTDEGST
ncbi:MAG: DUF222 domain-containing protein [Acidimicrobiales bacterium]